eukprot:7906296-Pyramimonas_sp.AAC.1
MPEVRELLHDFGSVYFKKVIEFNPQHRDMAAVGEEAVDAQADTRRYTRKSRVLSMTTEHFFKVTAGNEAVQADVKCD